MRGITDYSYPLLLSVVVCSALIIVVCVFVLALKALSDGDSAVLASNQVDCSEKE